MSEEIKNLNPEELENVAGGMIGGSGNGNAIGYYNTLEEAEFAASGICPRCGKVFSDTQAIDNHIKEWASGKK